MIHIKSFGATIIPLLTALSLVSSCTGGPILPIPTISPTTNPTPLPSPTSTLTPAPTPTPSTQYSYNIPLKVYQIGECNLGDRTLFEINAQGIFTYQSGSNSETKTRQLTEDEINSLKNLLNQINIASLSEKDVVLGSGSPQTQECRTVEYYSILVNNQGRTFDKNVRLKTHTAYYITSLQRLKNKLEELKKAPNESYIYSLPLRVTGSNECGEFATLGITHEVKEDGTYMYKVDNKTETKILNQGQISDLLNLLKVLDIARLAEIDTIVPPGSPQTLECRTIETFIFKVQDTERIFDRNGRQFIHTKEYLDALNILKTRLDDLKK